MSRRSRAKKPAPAASLKQATAGLRSAAPSARANWLMRVGMPLVLVGALAVWWQFRQLPPAAPPQPDSAGHALLPVDLDVMEAAVAEVVSAARQRVQDPSAVASAWGEYAMVLDAHGLVPEAAQAYERAVDLSPADFRWVYHRAVLEADNGRPDAALTWFEKARALRPDDALCAYRMGRTLLDLGRFDAAVQAFEAAVRSHSDFGLAHRELGQAQLGRGQPQAAAASLERARILLPQDAGTLSLLAQSWQRQGLADAATPLIEQAKDLQRVGTPADPLRRDVAERNVSSARGLHRGLKLFTQGAYAEARSTLRAVLEVRPDNPYAHVLFGSSSLALGHIDDAERAFRTAIQFKPDFVEAHVNLGRALVARGDLDAGITSFRHALELDENDVTAHLKLAMALTRADQVHDALFHFRAANAVGTLGPEDLVNWGVALLDAGDTQAALLRCQAAEAANAQYAKGPFAVGYVLARRGELEQAVAAYERALALQPDYVDALDNLAVSLTALGRHAEAARRLEEVQALRPTAAVQQRLDAARAAAASKAP